jgi:predicted ATPase
MAHPIDAPIVCPILVGRELPLAALRERFDAAIAGQGLTVLVAGEAGIGKSRLVTEASISAREQGMRVLTGQCFEPDHALPYAPWRDLIRTHLLDQPWAAEALAKVAPDLVDLVPELARFESGEASITSSASETDRRRVVDAVARLLAMLSKESPLLLIVEDVHWSDVASLELLLPLARRIHASSGLPATLIVTYRHDEISPALATTLAALDRERLAAEVRLGPLPRAEVLAMLRAMGDGHGVVGAQTAETIYRLGARATRGHRALRPQRRLSQLQQRGSGRASRPGADGLRRKLGTAGRGQAPLRPDEFLPREQQHRAVRCARPASARARLSVSGSSSSSSTEP